MLKLELILSGTFFALRPNFYPSSSFCFSPHLCHYFSVLRLSFERDCPLPIEKPKINWWRTPWRFSLLLSQIIYQTDIFSCLSKLKKLLMVGGNMGVARVFSGEEHFFKKFSKNIQKIFRKSQKKFRKKITKNGFFSIFFKQFNKPSIQFLRVWTKNASTGKFRENFRK